MKKAAAGFVLLTSMLLVTALPAGAQTFDPSRFTGPAAGGLPVSPVDDGANPVQSCLANNNTVIVHSPFGDEESELPSLAACVSSLAFGRLSWLAFYQNCQQLEAGFAEENESGLPYPYSFYGNPDYTAHNRLDCVYFTWAFHTGRLAPGPGA